MVICQSKWGRVSWRRRINPRCRHTFCNFLRCNLEAGLGFQGPPSPWARAMARRRCSPASAADFAEPAPALCAAGAGGCSSPPIDPARDQSSRVDAPSLCRRSLRTKLKMPIFPSSLTPHLRILYFLFVFYTLFFISCYFIIMIVLKFFRILMCDSEIQYHNVTVNICDLFRCCVGIAGMRRGRCVARVRRTLVPAGSDSD